MPIVTFKDGTRRHFEFNPKMAARLMHLGHKVDPDLDLKPDQLKKETREIQREYDHLCQRESLGLPV